MVMDYSERRQSQRIQQPKRPQRPSVWPYALIIIAMISSAFLAGVGAGWYLFRPGGKLCKVPLPVQPQAGKPPAAQQAQAAPAASPAPQAAGQQPQSQQQPLNALPAAEKGAPVPLTFYNTLQKGNKELMGTGINQPKEGQGGAAKSAPPAHPER